MWYVESFFFLIYLELFINFGFSVIDSQTNVFIIVITQYTNSYNKANEMHNFPNLFDKLLYMFRKGPLSIIRSISTLYTRNWYFHASSVGVC